jgi:hypothetical protein
MSDGTCQLQAVHRSGHIDVGEYSADIGATFKNADALIGIGSLYDVEARFFRYCRR